MIFQVHSKSRFTLTIISKSFVLNQAIRDVTYLYGDCSQHFWSLIPKDHEIEFNNNRFLILASKHKGNIIGFILLKKIHKALVTWTYCDNSLGQWTFTLFLQIMKTLLCSRYLKILTTCFFSSKLTYSLTKLWAIRINAIWTTVYYTAATKI